MDAATSNDPNYSVLDLTGNTVFSMKKREYCELIGEALKKNTHITVVRLAKCTLDAVDAKVSCFAFWFGFFSLYFAVYCIWIGGQRHC